MSSPASTHLAWDIALWPFRVAGLMFAVPVWLITVAASGLARPVDPPAPPLSRPARPTMRAPDPCPSGVMARLAAPALPDPAPMSREPVDTDSDDLDQVEFIS
jgi:hypothetical protein